MSIKTQFEVELNRLRDAYGEEMIYEAASDSKLMALAQSSNPKDKRKLFEQCNNRFFGGEAPFGEPIFAEEFSHKLFNNLNDKLTTSNNAAKATKLFNVGGTTTGIGRGEVLLAYLIENCVIGGGSQSIDLTLTDKNGKPLGGNENKCECKEAKRSKDGWLYGWKTAANHRSIIDTAKRDLRALWNALKDIQPEFTGDEGAEIADKMDRGEGSAFIKVVKDLHPVEIQIPLTFDIKELHGDLVISKVGGQVIGSLSDKNIHSELKILLKHQTKTRIKSYKTIEKELAEAFGNINEKFVFCHSIGDKHKFGGFYFYESLPGRVGSIRINAMTAGTIKVEVKSN